MTTQYITRKGKFDAAHRVMNQKFKCRNIHGHEYHYELTFKFGSTQDLGYAVDFAEIKRIGCQWIDDFLDHGGIWNPKDSIMIDASKDIKSKYWIMSLNGKDEYCNPSAENIAKEIFLAMEAMFEGFGGFSLFKLQLWETMNCYTDCFSTSISVEERENFECVNKDILTEYIKTKGSVEYDDRK